MKYAIVAVAWLIAWGAGAPQDARAGFVLSVDNVISDAAALRPLDADDGASVPPTEAGERLSVLDNLLGTLQFPCGTHAPSNSRQLLTAANALAVTDSAVQALCQSSLSSRLPPDRMFSLEMMFKSSVFRPPRA